MRYFAGPEVSLEETADCIVVESGEIVKEFRVASEPEALIAALRQLDLPLERIGIEACSLSSWLHHGLCSEVLPAIGVETRHANPPRRQKTMIRIGPNKTDRNDAWALAQIMRTPGVGPITARAFRATIDHPNRFRRSRNAGAHLGLTPARCQSGETDIQGRISGCGDSLPGSRSVKRPIACWFAAGSALACVPETCKLSNAAAWPKRVSRWRENLW